MCLLPNLLDGQAAQHGNGWLIAEWSVIKPLLVSCVREGDNAPM